MRESKLGGTYMRQWGVVYTLMHWCTDHLKWRHDSKMAFSLETATDEQKLLVLRGYCARPTRNPAAKGPYCTQNAGHKTDHQGEGACWLHGGNNVIKSGRYSSVKRTRVADLIAEMEETEEPLNTMPEVAATRALLVDYIERYDEFTHALIAWHMSYTAGVETPKLFSSLEVLLEQMEANFTEAELKRNRAYQACIKAVASYKTANPKPIQILDVADAVRFLSEVTKMVERIGKSMSLNAVSRRDFQRIMTEIGNIIDNCVQDDRTKLRIRDKIGNLRLA